MIWSKAEADCSLENENVHADTHYNLHHKKRLTGQPDGLHRHNAQIRAVNFFASIYVLSILSTRHHSKESEKLGHITEQHFWAIRKKKTPTLRSHSHLLKLKKPIPIQNAQLMAVIYYLFRSTVEVRRSHHEMVLPKASNLQHRKNYNTVCSCGYPVKSNWMKWKIVPAKEPKLSAFIKKTTGFHQHKHFSAIQGKQALTKRLLHRVAVD